MLVNCFINTILALFQLIVMMMILIMCYYFLSRVQTGERIGPWVELITTIKKQQHQIIIFKRLELLKVRLIFRQAEQAAEHE